MSLSARIFDIFLRIFAKPLLKYVPLDPARLAKMQVLDKKHNRYRALPPGAYTEECELNEVPTMLVKRNVEYNKEDGVILYLHGGGYCAGSCYSYKRLVWPLAKTCDMPAYIIDYRQSPNHVFPAALDDSISAYKALLDKGYLPEQIFIMGDSAGGNLTLATLLKIKALRLPQPNSAVTISPWADLSHSGGSIQTNERKDSYIPGKKQLDVAAKLYAGDTPLDDPFLSPLFGDFQGLAPIKIIVGDIEVLLDDAIRVAEKAKAAGVEVDYKAWAGQSHVFTLFNFLPEARACQREIKDFTLRRKQAPKQQQAA